MFFQNWFKKEIIYIWDIINPISSTVIKFEDMKIKFDLTNCNYMEYYKIQTLTNKYLRHLNKEDTVNLYLNHSFIIFINHSFIFEMQSIK